MGVQIKQDIANQLRKTAEEALSTDILIKDILEPLNADGAPITPTDNFAGAAQDTAPKKQYAPIAAKKETSRQFNEATHLDFQHEAPQSWTDIIKGAFTSLGEFLDVLFESFRDPEMAAIKQEKYGWNTEKTNTGPTPLDQEHIQPWDQTTENYQRTLREEGPGLTPATNPLIEDVKTPDTPPPLPEVLEIEETSSFKPSDSDPTKVSALSRFKFNEAANPDANITPASKLENNSTPKPEVNIATLA